jgi:hypothetical protein
MKLEHYDPQDGVLTINIPSDFPANVDFSWIVHVVTCGLLDPGEKPRLVTFDSGSFSFELTSNNLADKEIDDAVTVTPHSHCWSGLKTAHMVYHTKYLDPTVGKDVCTWKMTVLETGDHGSIDLQLVFRGTNPSKDAIHQALGNDVMRSIAWNESTWRQYGSSGLPLRNQNSNGTSDWGLMQLNDIHQLTHEMKWDWEENIVKGLSIYATGANAAKKYLDAHGKYDDQMLLKESIQRYNGHVFHKWDAQVGSWIESPPNGGIYVARVLNIMATKPW